MTCGGVLWAVDEELTVDGQGGSYSEAFSGSAIDLVGNGIELLLAVDRQVCGHRFAVRPGGDFRRSGSISRRRQHPAA